MNFFDHFHPRAMALYYIGVVTVSLMVFDPVCYLLFFLSQAILYLYVKKLREGMAFVLKCLGFAGVCALVNMLVNHRGESVIFYVRGLPLTWECLIYGGLTGVFLASTLLLFGGFQVLMDSEKLMCLFAGRFPHFSMLFSLSLRLVPKLKRDYKKIRENHPRHPGIITSLVGLALEDSMEMGIVMKNRGYASGKRTSIYQRQMGWRDKVFGVLVLLLVSGGLILYKRSGASFLVFPYVDYRGNTGTIAAYVVWGIFMNLPMAINLWEEWKWKRIVLNISNINIQDMRDMP